MNITLAQTMETANSQLRWAFDRAVVVKEYDECVEKRFSGRIHPAMADKIIHKNNWNNVSSNLKNGINEIEYASSENIGVEFVHRTGIFTLTYYEAK